MRSDVVVIASIDASMQPTLQDNQLMSKHRVLSFKPQLRLEWRGQDGQSETEQPDHSVSLGDSITSSTRIRFSVHTTTLMAGRSPILAIQASPAITSCAEPDKSQLISGKASGFL